MPTCILSPSRMISHKKIKNRIKNNVVITGFIACMDGTKKRWGEGDKRERKKERNLNPNPPPFFPSSRSPTPLDACYAALAGFVLCSPKFKSLAMLVNSQLVCLRPVGILSHIMFHLSYWFIVPKKSHKGRG